MASKKSASVPSKTVAGRLQRADWIWAGFRALVSGGPQALKVEPIARELDTTKGSFYWHFTDLAALKAAMLETWEQVATADITADVRQSGLPPRAQLLLLVERVSARPGAEAGGDAVEPAIRDWGRTDATARRALEGVDRRRLGDLRGFFEAAGLSPVAATQSAALFYAAVIGLENLRLTTKIPMHQPLRTLAEQLLKTAKPLSGSQRG